MFGKAISVVAAASLAIGLAASAEAAPVGPRLNAEITKQSDLTQVRHRRGGRWHGRHRDRDGFSFGFSFGSPGYSYYAPRSRYYNYYPQVIAPPVVYYGAPRPWTAEWYAYCSDRYRSFNARTGYFTTYSGHKRFCS